MCTAQPSGSGAVHARSVEGTVVATPRAEIEEEAVRTARLLPRNGIDLVVVDTESHFLARGLGQRISEAGRGVHHRLPGGPAPGILQAAASLAGS
mmetsp:Transcript_30830/g.73424  ORF Transcript_30830/g.73424 Transcript_30830/m.73424 type:complete len:95 (+) Transcript_30830:2-286(+)